MTDGLRKTAALLRTQARQRGDKTFISNTNCRSCGSNVRYTSSGGCLACSLARSKGREEYLREWFQKNKGTIVKEYRIKNSEKLREQRKQWEQSTDYKKKWKEKNKEKTKKYFKTWLEGLKADPIRFEEAKSKQKIKSKAYYLKFSKSIKDRARKYYQENREKALETNRAWVLANRDKVNAINKKYTKSHPDRVLANVRKRQLLKRQAIPNWVDEAAFKKIQSFYEAARRKTLKTGVPHEVDHIYPLKGDDVCGLHVPENLRIISRFENRSKGNKLIEDNS